MAEIKENSTNVCKELFGSERPRQCNNCEKFKKDKGLGDFICRHMRGYKEAPPDVRRCFDCEVWRAANGITSNFWCKHNKYLKKEWDRNQGW